MNWFTGNHSRLLHNDGPKRSWLNVEVRGKKINRMGIGSKVVVRATGESERQDELLGFQEISTGYRYASGQPAICHFGFGDRLRVNVTVRLPNGMMISRSGVAANQTLILKELDRE